MPPLRRQSRRKSRLRGKLALFKAGSRGGILRIALAWVLLLAGSAYSGDSPPSGPVATSRPNVVIITLDTTRADRMGFLGSDRGLTPNLDALARQATVFSHAYAQVPLTSPSHASIFTGTYPQFNHVNYMGDPLDTALPYLPDILHNSGYKTAAFIGALVLDAKKLAPGFDRGFDVYDAGFHRRRTSEDHYQSLERRGEEVVGRALAWLGKQHGRPFFLWVHLYDPHDPYSPPQPYKTRYQTNAYDGEIAYTDSIVGKLVGVLRARGLFQGTLIAVMADHGEAFGEHEESHHGIFLYDETIHVPLLLKLPGRQAGKKVETQVGLVDVAPSILQAVHLPVPSAVQGRSLLNLPSSEKASLDHPIYAESSYGHLSFGWSTLRAWRTGRYLYVEAPERELYDQSVDPLAVHNLAAESRPVVDTAAAQVADFLRKTKSESTGKTNLSAEQAESLHALGYMSSDSRVSSHEESEDGPDPKQRIATANLLYEALVDMENERFQDAVPALEQVIKQEPNTPTAYLQLGRAYMALREYQKAVAPLQTLVERKPDDAFAHYEYGCALVKTGNWVDATPHFEAAVAQMKSSAMMHFYLALVYQRTSRSTEALTEFQDSLRLDPNHFPANLLLGRLFLLQQKAKDALPYLRKASKLRPDAIDAHKFLADAYGQLGQEVDAGRENVEVERLSSRGGSRLGTPTKDEADIVER
jgi:arylsulfatase A-like enzyme/Tfp pilus assembly protein PilF